MRAFLCALFLSLPALASADPVAQGESLARAADAQLRGYGDQQTALEMTLISPTGETATRALRVQSLETDDGERTLMVFDTPRDLTGTALLSHNRRQGDDEQWLYLPAVKRVKQIGARNKSGPFMGSEFAYEDIVTPFWEKFSYRFEGEEPCAELTCAVVERIPKDSYSGYTRQRLWLDTAHHRIQRIEYYDRKNSLLKTYTATGFEQHAGQHWRPAEMHMQNHQTGKQTRLRWSEFAFGRGLSAQDFTQNALMRAR
ncbi:MAG: outer membrane lipoprotein-sorting protein [Gammaproteobacteria bacterium]|nr:outer membrane lipoprotein-sorting protein [Gammaproteobacteria bacterium]